MLPWDLLTIPYHQGIYHCLAALNHFYLSHPALYVDDFSPDGFEWIEPFDEKKLVLSYLRKGGGETLLCIHHFYPEVLRAISSPSRENRKKFSLQIQKNTKDLA